MKILPANGDSHTSGSYPGSKTFFNKDAVWAKYLADDLNAQYLNISNAGAGTEEVFVSTITCVHSLIEFDKINPQNLFVCILWGIDNRKYQFWNGEQHQSYCLEASWEPPAGVKEYVSARTQIESNGYDSYKDLYNIYVTAVALERYGIPYLFMNNKPFKQPADKNISDLYENVLSLYGNRADRHIGFYNKEESFDGYLYDRVEPMVMSGPENKMAYWTTDGHKLWKEFIHGKLGN